MIALYAKSLVYVALALIGFAITAVADNVITTEELLNGLVVVLGAFVVYLIPNLPAGVAKYSKAIVAFGIAGVVALLSFLSGGVTLAEWLQVIVAAAAGVGVVIVPNAKPAFVPGVTLRDDLN
jgi:hypothetical protein